MSALESALLTYLINSVWQLPLLSVAGWLAARLLRPAGPAAEHRVWVGTLLLQLLLPACAASPLAWLRALPRWSVGPAHASSATVSTLLGEGTASLHLSSTLLHGAAALYLAVLLVSLARFLWRSLRLRDLRQHAEPFPLTPHTRLVWRRCCTHFAVSDAVLATSPRLSSPVTLGLRQSLILIPADLLPSLSERDLETVFAHEFAHIHRHDFAKNLLYTALALPLGYHPLLRLTCSRITETRELVCDQLAAELTGRVPYAQSLLRLASRIVTGTRPLASHAIGILDAHRFERRLMRLATHPLELHGIRRVLTLGACATLFLGTCTSAIALRFDLSAPSAQSVATSNSASSPSSSASTGAVKISSEDMAANVLTRVAPVYPPAAKEARIEGAVVLHVVIGKDGVVDALQVLSGPEDLRKSALDAVRQWTYKPYRLNGDDTAVETTVTVNYHLEP